jgi:tetratricopeptide (TPR) repeat protein
VAALDSGLEPGALRIAIDTVLASVSAGQPRDQLCHLEDEHLARLSRASVEFDPRDDAEISESLRSRLRQYRNRCRAGLGDESAGLMIDHLVSEIFRRAGNAVEATLPVSDFRALLLVDGATLAETLGRRDWGVVVGPLPAVPDVRRADELDQIHAALPLTAGQAATPRCTLTGMSGIGKTSLAAGYILDRADIYDVIFWVDAESEQTLASSFTRISRYLHGGDSSPPPDPAHLRGTVLTDLSCAAGRWLLILDNCVNLRLTEKWMPQAGSGHVIVTTTDSASPSRAGSRVEVEGMAVLQAVELLRRRLASAGEVDGPHLKQLVRLARELECWPLALELASAYLHGGGLGIDGIPEYLRRLKLRSLRDPDSVPPGYPRTLIQAIDLCVQRIKEKAEALEPQDAWAGVAALGVLRIAAYLSSRQIPVYLVMSVPQVDLDKDAFRGMNPVVWDSPDHHPAEVVRMLRTQSLVAIDERLPPGGMDSDDDRPYDYTISINSVVQETIRAGFDSDERTPWILNALAWHTERWMKAAMMLSAHERTLVLAAHAAAIEDHAARLHLKSDSIAYLRGNLASVHYHQNRRDEAIRLLRSEIDHYRGRQDELAEVLTCQASIQLSALLATDPAASVDESVRLLEAAYSIVLNSVPSSPEGMAFLAANIQSILGSMQRLGFRHERLEMFIGAIDDLTGRLPVTPIAMALRTLAEIDDCMHEHRDCARARELATRLLAQDSLDVDIEENVQIRCMARKFLIEALAVLDDFGGALKELEQFNADTQSNSLFVREIEDLVHNVGLYLAGRSLGGSPLAKSLLTRLLRDDWVRLIERSFPAEAVSRIRLLSGVNYFNCGDLHLARQRVDEFLGNSALDPEYSPQREGWRKFGATFAGILAAEQRRSRDFGTLLSRLRDQDGFGRFLSFPWHVQATLSDCTIEQVPLYAALAILQGILTGPPGHRCVPVCFVLDGCLRYLGFESEVVAASAVLRNPVDGSDEHVGEWRRAPRLSEDGRTDGHAVVWAASLRQLADPTIGQARLMRAAAEVTAGLDRPVVLHIPDPDILNVSSAICAYSRKPVMIGWFLHPQWTEAISPVQGSHLHMAISYGELALARMTVELLRGLCAIRPDVEQLRMLYPSIGSLLDGSVQLPRLPDEPPAAFPRLLRRDGQE